MRTRIALSISLMAFCGGLCLFAQVKEFRPVTEAMLRPTAEEFRETSRSMATRFLRQREMHTSLPWMLGQGRSCGTLKLPIHNSGTNTHRDRSSFEAR